jgi:L-rhamnose isomerase
MRYPLEEFALGALTNPSSEVRKKAVRLTIEACHVARKMGAREVVVWPQADGYDYYFQVDYAEVWDRAVDSFREISDVCGKDIKVSLEWKPTDQVSRFAVVGSTAAALLLIAEVKRENFGLTLDLGHSLMAGENPAQSVAMATRAGKLFGVQLGDAYQRMGAEDGLAVASVNPRMVLEVVYWLRKAAWDGIWYFDTFPSNEDPVREGEMNIRTITRMWKKAGELGKSRRLSEYQARHDAMSILEMLEKDEL